MQHQINRKKRFPFSVFLRIEFLSFLATNIGGKTRRDVSRRTICREIVTVSATNRRPKPNYHVDVSRSPTFEARLQTMPDPKLSFFFPFPQLFFDDTRRKQTDARNARCPRGIRAFSIPRCDGKPFVLRCELNERNGISIVGHR